MINRNSLFVAPRSLAGLGTLKGSEFPGEITLGPIWRAASPITSAIRWDLCDSWDLWVSHISPMRPISLIG